MKRRKVLKVALVILTIGLIWNHLPYYYCNDKAVDYISRHAGTKSKCSCAGYVMRGMWRGGCPIGLLPAYAYSKNITTDGVPRNLNERLPTSERGCFCYSAE